MQHNRMQLLICHDTMFLTHLTVVAMLCHLMLFYATLLCDIIQCYPPTTTNHQHHPSTTSHHQQPPSTTPPPPATISAASSWRPPTSSPCCIRYNTIHNKTQQNTTQFVPRLDLSPHTLPQTTHSHILYHLSCASPPLLAPCLHSTIMYLPPSPC